MRKFSIWLSVTLGALATLQILVDFGNSMGTSPSSVNIVRLDPRLNAIVPENAIVEKLADGFSWVEGPVWNRVNHYLLFSDIPKNEVIKWNGAEPVSVFLKPSGYTGLEPFAGREPGSNGLTFDSQNRLVLCQHGDRKISRLEKDGSRTTLVERYEGKRLNSPNDVVFKSNGDMYFTDPPYGLPNTFSDKDKELDFQGVYRYSEKTKDLTLLTKEFQGPNGIAFSPDEKKLYISDSKGAAWYVFDVNEDGTISNKRLVLDAKEQKKNGPGGPDGIKTDVHGNIFGAGPGGLYIFTPEGNILGRLQFGVPVGNCAWGEDGSTLFITANTAIYKIRLNTEGAKFSDE
jgi:gluconolactonase